MNMKKLRAWALPMLTSLALCACVQASWAQRQAQAIQTLAPSLSELPLGDALVTVRGRGSRQLAVFSDPNCPYCKRLERELAQLQDVTLYTFLIPVLGPDSEQKSQRIWCAAEPGLAWRRWMLEAAAPASAHCDAEPVMQRNLALARRLGVQGTPTLLTARRQLLVGVIPAAQLSAQL